MIWAILGGLVGLFAAHFLSEIDSLKAEIEMLKKRMGEDDNP